MAALQQVSIPFQPEDTAVPFQHIHVEGVFHDAAAGGNDQMIPGGQFVQYLSFDFAEGCFSFFCKKFGDRHANAFYDLMVGIHKGFSQFFSGSFP